MFHIGCFRCRIQRAYSDCTFIEKCRPFDEHCRWRARYKKKLAIYWSITFFICTIRRNKTASINIFIFISQFCLIRFIILFNWFYIFSILRKIKSSVIDRDLYNLLYFSYVSVYFFQSFSVYFFSNFFYLKYSVRDRMTTTYTYTACHIISFIQRMMKPFT